MPNSDRNNQRSPCSDPEQKRLCITTAASVISIVFALGCLTRFFFSSSETRGGDLALASIFSVTTVALLYGQHRSRMGHTAGDRQRVKASVNSILACVSLLLFNALGGLFGGTVNFQHPVVALMMTLFTITPFLESVYALVESCGIFKDIDDPEGRNSVAADDGDRL